jgi:hypothetical protein
MLSDYQKTILKQELRGIRWDNFRTIFRNFVAIMGWWGFVCLALYIFLDL